MDAQPVVEQRVVHNFVLLFDLFGELGQVFDGDADQQKEKELPFSDVFVFELYPFAGLYLFGFTESQRKTASETSFFVVLVFGYLDKSQLDPTFAR